MNNTGSTLPDAPMLVVAAALVDPTGLVLVQQRPLDKTMAGLWEFPGGKIEPGEIPEAALIRELEEELGITVAGSSITPAAFASNTLFRRHLILLLYICRVWTGVPRPLDAIALRWVRIEDLRDLAMPPADRPLIELLQRLV